MNGWESQKINREIDYLRDRNYGGGRQISECKFGGGDYRIVTAGRGRRGLVRVVEVAPFVSRVACRDEGIKA